MIKSMTGYGKATALINSINTTVEVRSLNSKSVDLYLRVPSLYKTHEMDLRSILTEHLVRGKIECTIQRSDNGNNKSTINKSLVKSYFQELKSLEEELGSTINDKLSIALSMPEVMVSEKIEADEEEWIELKSLLNLAITNIIDYRLQEGAMMKKDLLRNIDNIAKLKQEVQPISAKRLDKIKERIRKSLQTNLDEVRVDENRFEQELIYYIEKIDVNEELIRLQSNIDYFLEIIHEENSEGKKLRFISQELGREINTLGAKSYDADMQKIVIKMKDELEKIKEQLLNVL